MKLKIILFTNENSFFNFNNILYKLAYEIYIDRQHDSLTDRIEKRNKNYFSSKWLYIMKLMFSQIFIPDYSKIKDLENKNKDYLIKNLKSYEIDKFQFYYLKRICSNKLKKLNFLSFKLKISLINIIRIYSDLCIKEITKKRNVHLSTLKGDELLFNKNKKMNNISKKYNFNLGIKQKSTKMATLFFNSLFKSEIPTLRENKKRKDSVITNIISKNNNTIDLFGKRNNSANQKLLYCNSFTRLFIGETDKDSIIERHLSNILVLKPSDLKINGSYIDLSERYLLKIFSNLKKNKKLLIDESLKETLEKFKVNQKYLDNFNKRNSIKDSKIIKINNSKPNINININDIPMSNKNEIENKIINSYNYKPYKIRKMNSVKIRNNKKPKTHKKMKNQSSILIENLCKELSDSENFTTIKKYKNKTIKKNIVINTEYSIHDKNKNIFLRNNNNFCNNHFRTKTITNYSYSKKGLKDNVNRKYLFYNIKI